MTGGRDPITLDVMIIGAGPSALMAADYLAHAGRRVVLMEGKASPARKFLMAGKSGLNLTMDEPLEAFPVKSLISKIVRFNAITAPRLSFRLYFY